MIAIAFKPSVWTAYSSSAIASSGVWTGVIAVGVIRSELKSRSKAPRQGSEGAPDAWLEVNSSVAKGLQGLTAGDDIIVITWFHRRA